MHDQALIYVEIPNGKKVSIDAEELYILRVLSEEMREKKKDFVNYIDIAEKASREIEDLQKIYSNLKNKGLVFQTFEDYRGETNMMSTMIPWLLGEKLEKNRVIGGLRSYGIKDDVFRIIAPYTKITK